MKISRSQLRGMIDHTCLKPDATRDDIVKLCEEARRYGFGAVCVSTANVPRAVGLLLGTNVHVCAVVGFPLGSMSSEAKAFEATMAVESGASEIDMVINIGALKSQEHDLVHRDIGAVVRASKAINSDAIVKAIIEACYLSDAEKVRACELAREAGADFVKTSTGFGPSGASASDVKLMRQTVGPKMGIKAAGGIRTWTAVLEMIEAGATRIGSSSGPMILEEFDASEAMDATHRPR